MNSRRARRVSAALACAILATLLGGCRREGGIEDPGNELPFGRIDIPADGAQVKAQAPIAGWALDDRGVTEIRIYVDGHLVSRGGLINERPDLAKFFPQYTHGATRHGWTLIMAFDVPGPHTVIAQAVDSDGATRDIGTLTVTAIEK